MDTENQQAPVQHNVGRRRRAGLRQEDLDAINRNAVTRGFDLRDHVNTLLSSAAKSTVTPLNTQPPVQSLIDTYLIHIPPDRQSLEAHKKYLYFLSLCKLNDIERNTQKWGSLVATYAYMVVTPQLNNVNMQGLSVQDMRQQVFDSLIAFIDALEEIDNNDVASRRALSTEFRTAFPNFPFPYPVTKPASLIDLGTPMFAFWGILGVEFFSIHKAKAENASTALRSTRYRAMINQVNVDPDSIPLWTNQMIPQIDQLRLIANAYQNLPALVQKLTLLFLSYSEVSVAREHQVLSTFFRMMKWVDFAHVPIISQFLTKYPIAYHSQELAPYIEVYSRGLKECIDRCPYATTPAGNRIYDAQNRPVRNIQLLPYLKLYYRDQMDSLKQDSVRPLLSVAVDMLVEQEPSFREYAVSGSYSYMTENFRSLLNATSDDMAMEEQDVE